MRINQVTPFVTGQSDGVIRRFDTFPAFRLTLPLSDAVLSDTVCDRSRRNGDQRDESQKPVQNDGHDVIHSEANWCSITGSEERFAIYQD